MASSNSIAVEQPLYTPYTVGECDCPIHASGDPPTLPLGIEFSDRVHIEEIDRETAAQVYEAHHSYMPTVPQVNVCHHGIYLDGQLTGALTYRAPLINKLLVYLGPNGHISREQYEGYERYMINGGNLMEVNRICIGVPMKNLASCALAHSMDKFIDDHAERLDSHWLLTFIRADHTGSMLRALIKKGWELAGMSGAKPPGNRPVEDIHSWQKYRWMYQIETDLPQ